MFATEIDIPVAWAGAPGVFVGDGRVATIVAGVSYRNCSETVWPTETEAVCAGATTSWSPTPVPSITLTVYVPAGMKAK